MNVWESVALALSSMTGGLVGASSAAYLASLRASAEMQGFRQAFTEYMRGRTDDASAMLAASFEELDQSWKSLDSALARLARAAKPRR